VKRVREIVDDTKGKDDVTQTETPKGGARMAAEEPDVLIEKIHQQATQLGPVLEAMLRESRGHSQWGLNE
jgi:hypothetical protein